MAQIYDRFQIDNGHLFAQLIVDTLLYTILQSAQPDSSEIFKQKEGGWP